MRVPMDGGRREVMSLLFGFQSDIHLLVEEGNFYVMNATMR